MYVKSHSIIYISYPFKAHSFPPKVSPIRARIGTQAHVKKVQTPISGKQHTHTCVRAYVHTHTRSFRGIKRKPLRILRFCKPGSSCTCQNTPLDPRSCEAMCREQWLHTKWMPGFKQKKSWQQKPILQRKHKQGHGSTIVYHVYTRGSSERKDRKTGCLRGLACERLF